MDYAPLYLGLRIDCTYRFLKTGKSVDTEEQNILQTAVF